MIEWKKGDKAVTMDATQVDVVGVEPSGFVIVQNVAGMEWSVDPDELKPLNKVEAYAAALGIKPEVIEPIEFNTIPGTVKVHLDSEEMRSLAELIKDGESFDLWMERLAGVDVLMVEVGGDHDPERWLIVGSGKVKLGR